MATASNLPQPAAADKRREQPSAEHRGEPERRWASDAEADDAALELAAQVLGHLADPTRLRLIRLLGEGEADVTALTRQVPASRSSVSQHLGRLRLAGLVRSRRVGRRMLYQVASAHLVQLAAQALDFADHQIRPLPAHHRQPLV